MSVQRVLTPAGPAVFGRALSLVAAGVTLYILWQFQRVFLLAFAAIIVAVLVRGVARLMMRYLSLPEWLSVPAALVSILLVLGGLIFAFGAQVAAQVSQVAGQLPQAFDSVLQPLGLNWTTVEGEIIDQLQAAGGSLLSRAATFGNAAASLLATLILVIIAGVFMAMQPRDYRGPLLRKLGPQTRASVARFLGRAGSGLEEWLLAQLVSMTLVGLLTGFGLWIIGVPAPAALGLLAGLFEFVPVLGPWLAAVPVLLIAAAQDATTALWAAGLVLLVQQLESNMITPMVMRGMTDLQPAVVLFAVFAFGSLFGILGVILAVPLTLVLSLLIESIFEDQPSAPSFSESQATAGQPTA